MINFNYKIQWKINSLDQLKQLFKSGVFPVNGFDYIEIRDFDWKLQEKYSGYISYGNGIAEKETIKYLKKYYNHNYYFILVRK